MTARDWSSVFDYLTEDEKRFVIAAVEKQSAIWEPLPGPQTIAYESTADVIGYGGAAGGGKTDLGLGKALTQHRKVAIFRREATQLTGVIDRLTELLGGRDGFNGQEKIWRNAGPRNVQIEFGSVPNLGDETKHQGRPKDLLVIEEAANFLAQQVRFLMGWVRTTTQGQRCQTLMTFNPPTSAEGQWILEFFAPWLNTKHPNPAQPGELRWFATIDGSDIEVPDNRPFILREGERVYNFDPKAHDGADVIKPLSRTFIPSRVSDNPYLSGTGYMATLQSLPEPLRSQMLYGDFQAGMEDDPWQVIPTAWVEAAMARWERPLKLPQMTSLGVDVARGGRDNTVIARRHDMWFDVPLVYAGSQTPDGPAVAGLVIAAARDGAPQHIDVIGVGSSPYDFLKHARQPAVGVNVAEKSVGTDQSGRLGFFNKRSELAWRMREALDPNNNTGIALPSDNRLKADLCAFTWELQGRVVKVESREDVIKRIGRSPDFASAYFLALIDTVTFEQFNRQVQQTQRATTQPYDPYNSMRNGANTAYYDPYGNLR